LRDVREAVHDVRFALEAEADLAERHFVGYLDELLSAGEPGVALEDLLSNLADYDIPVFASTADLLARAATTMGMTVASSALRIQPFDSSVTWEFDDKWWLGWRHERLVLADTTPFQVQFRIGTNGHLSVEGPALLAKSAGEVRRAPTVEPANDEFQRHCQAMHDQDVLACVAFKDGTVRLVVADGLAITIPPSPDFEAWTARTSRGHLLVSLPGGGLSVFAPPPPQPEAPAS